MTENYTAQNEASEFVANRTYDAVRALCDIIGIRYAIDTNTSLVLAPYAPLLAAMVTGAVALECARKKDE